MSNIAERPNIRIAEMKDSELIVRHYNIVGGETHYHTFGFGEYSKTVAEQEKIINDTIKRSNSLFIVAEANNKIVGVLTFIGGKSYKTYHHGNLGITIQKRYWGNRIGTNMMNYLLDWCDENNEVKKINLIVHEDNKRAISLYEKLGFAVEGESEMYFRNGETYSTAIYMGKKV